MACINPACTASNLRNESLRADSEVRDASSAGFSTPPPGNLTPLGVNGVHGSAAHGSQVDVMEVDGMGNTLVSATPDRADEEDAEFKTWKQVTKKDRAEVAAERNRLFRGEQYKTLNENEPALLRNKAMMRRWMRQQKAISTAALDADPEATEEVQAAEQTAQGESLAEGIEKDEDSTLPDYYDPLSAVPEIDQHLRWVNDSEGYATSQTEEWLRIYPKGQFKTGDGLLAARMDSNMRQMQDTRKICSKIGIVKQMQIQAQVRLRGKFQSDPRSSADQIRRHFRINFKSTIPVR